MPTISVKSNIKGEALRGVPLQLDTIKTQHKSELDKYLKPCKPGESFEIVREVRRQGNFFLFELAEPIAGEDCWWVFGPNFSLPQHQSAPAVTGKDLPKEVCLDVPFLSQRNNEFNPHGACNVTSVAMCLAYFGHPVKNAAGLQLEDELYSYCERSGLSRHDPNDLAVLVTRYGYSDTFRSYTTWDACKRWLADGKPLISHGYWTTFGHIIVIRGYNEKGWIVNDPNGEWHSWGYDTSVSGEGLTYSYELMDAVSSPDGDLWIHFVSR